MYSFLFLISSLLLDLFDQFFASSVSFGSVFWLPSLLLRAVDSFSNFSLCVRLILEVI